MVLVRMLGTIVVVGLGLSACNDAGSGGSPATAESNAPRAVIGDLGGVPVRIPREFAKSVEYDDAPAILQPRQTPAPARDFSSKLRSFGFDFRYPDMAGPGSDEARKDKASHLPGHTFWISVGFNAGQDYRSAGSTERLASATLSSADPATTAFYRLGAEKTCGLETYVLAGEDTKSGRPHREHPNADDVFVGRDAAGRATTFIECSNRPLDAAPCRQHFDLEPEIHAMVYLTYRRGLLCEWQGIKSATSQLVNSFRVTAIRQ